MRRLESISVEKTTQEQTCQCISIIRQISTAPKSSPGSPENFEAAVPSVDPEAQNAGAHRCWKTRQRALNLPSESPSQVTTMHWDGCLYGLRHNDGTPQDETKFFAKSQTGHVGEKRRLVSRQHGELAACLPWSGPPLRHTPSSRLRGRVKKGDHAAVKEASLWPRASKALTCSASRRSWMYTPLMPCLI